MTKTLEIQDEKGVVSSTNSSGLTGSVQLEECKWIHIYCYAQIIRSPVTTRNTHAKAKSLYSGLSLEPLMSLTHWMGVEGSELVKPCLIITFRKLSNLAVT